MVRRIIFATLAGLTLLIGPTLAPRVHAQSIGDQYQDILDQGIIFANICDGSGLPCDCRDTGDCTVRDIIQVLVNVSVFILAIVGSLVLLMFIYGGLTWIISDGRESMITRGRQTLVGAVIGLVIVLGSYALIALVISILKYGQPPADGQNIEDLLDNGADTLLQTQ